MKNQTSKYERYLRKLLKDYTRANRFSPFPFYDTELIEVLTNKINKMQDRKKHYDSMPIACCKHCNSLHIIEDEVGNDACLSCGAEGTDIIEVYDNIFEYAKATGKKID